VPITAPAPPDLYVSGICGPEVEAYREQVREALADLTALQPNAEKHRAFPPEALRILGAAELLRDRWALAGHGDLGRSAMLAEELGYAGLGGIGVGISLHLEAVLSILTRFGRSEAADEICQGALDGRLVGCLATSERHAGSDLTSVTTTLRRTTDGWRVTGRKWFVSPGAAADFALVLGRIDTAGADQCGRGSPLALVIVPRSAMTIERTLETVGMRSLGTARISIAADVPFEHLVGQPGTGLATVTWGLIHERLAIAAQSLGSAQLAIGLATAHLYRRRQFGARLFDHQALRLRLAELSAQVAVTRRGVHETAAHLRDLPEHGLRAVAAAKVSATRLASHVADETMHMLGGSGYVETETPFARMWRDSRVGRLGAGSDEMMLELVASGLRGDDEAYERLVTLDA
jgi:alkylation response protein AidB-like acyl-CoA dehydrogenase